MYHHFRVSQVILSVKLSKSITGVQATRHAEMEAIDVLLEQWKKSGLTKEDIALRFLKCRLYVTCEPCIMCAAALSIIGMGRQIYSPWFAVLIDI